MSLREIIQYKNVEAKCIHLSPQICNLHMFAIHFGQGLKEEEISRFGSRKFHEFQVLLAVADNNLSFIIKPNNEKVQDFIYVLKDLMR